MGQTATKPDKVNILLCEANYDVAVKLTRVNDDVLKSNIIIIMVFIHNLWTC